MDEAGVAELTTPLPTGKSPEECKLLGNSAFAAARYSEAIGHYSTAIDSSDPNRHVYLCNRSLANHKLEAFGAAVQDATLAIELCPTFAKAYYRRGSAQLALRKFQFALKDFRVCAKLSPNDADAQLRVVECQKLVKQEKFAEAIASVETEVLSKTIKIETIAISPNYDGPVYDSENLKPEFLQQMIDYIKVPEKKLAMRYAYNIVLDTVALYQTVPTLVEIEVNDGEQMTVCGDVHGQFFDLLKIFESNGMPSTTNQYLFNGDFVDRGSFSTEVILTLFVAKLIFPKNFHLVRGNHEARSMNSLYGFSGEIAAKYDTRLYNLFCEAFRWLPLAHVLNNSIFVVHGGLSSVGDPTLAEIAAIDRNCEPPESGLMTDLLWSDPQEELGRSPSKRGTACCFGPDVTQRFLDLNNLKQIVRSHEMKERGYSIDQGGRTVTVFSAPNYCDSMGNLGAYIIYRGRKLTPEYVTFAASPHPDVKAMMYANRMLMM